MIDEAHSSQNGDLSTKMNIVLSGSEYDNDDLLEDKINTLIDGKKLAKMPAILLLLPRPKIKRWKCLAGKKFSRTEVNVFFRIMSTR